MTELPESFLPIVAKVLTEYSANSPRSLQRTVGPSELGTPCDRRLAHQILDTKKMPRRDVPLSALIGTGFHEVAADAFRKHGGGRFLVEQRVAPDPLITGTSDLFDLETMTVLDWKTAGETTITAVRATTPTGRPSIQKISEEYETQLDTYGLGFEKIGLTPKFVGLIFIPTSGKFGDSVEYIRPYDPLRAQTAILRYKRIKSRLDSYHPEEIQASPSRDNCRYCPYKRLGEASETGCPGDTKELTADNFLR